MPQTDPFAVVTREDRWDAIVMGAGPAGAIAARQLALQGRRVLLIDKSRLPRSKVCGGCLGGAAMKSLASIGLGALPLACGGVPLTTFELASGGVVARLPVGQRVAISRQTFDDALVREAMRVGVAVCDEVRGTLLPSDGGRVRQVALRNRTGDVTARASVVIAATGLTRGPAECTTRVAPGSYVGLGAILDRAPIATSVGVLHMACTSEGYVGVTAVENSDFDVAAAVDPHALAHASSPGQLVHDILSQSGLSPAIDLRTIPWCGTSLLTRKTTPLASHRCLLIGDAAGYVEPFTGEGIGWAIHSALMATALLAGPLETWDPSLPARWQQLYYNGLAAKQGTCRVLSRALRSRFARRVVTAGLRQAPALGRLMVTWLDRPLAAPTSI
jgi:flavin-dependent dehydrogenase